MRTRKYISNKRPLVTEAAVVFVVVVTLALALAGLVLNLTEYLVA